MSLISRLKAVVAGDDYLYDDFDEFEMDEDHYTDGKVYNASGNKP